jgi:hypothetical protein
MSYSEERNSGKLNIVTMQDYPEFLHFSDLVSNRDFIFHKEEIYV